MASINEAQQFCLRWNNFEKNFSSQFDTLRVNEDFVDVTLACDGRTFGAHKVVLSACSSFFMNLFKRNPCSHPIIFMRDMTPKDVEALLEFVYLGEVNVAQANLGDFLRTAESLQIRGLTETTKNRNSVIKNIGNEFKPENEAPCQSTQTDDLVKNETIETKPMNNNPPKRSASQHSPVHFTKVCKTENLFNPEDTKENSQYDISEAQIDFKDGILEPKIEPDYDDNGTDMVDLMSGFDELDCGMQLGSESGNLTPDPLPDTTGDSNTGFDPRKLHCLDPHPCQICGRLYSNLSNLRQHMRLVHHPQTVSCVYCGKQFKTTLYLKRHLVIYHVQSEQHLQNPSNTTIAKTCVTN